MLSNSINVLDDILVKGHIFYYKVKILLNSLSGNDLTLSWPENTSFLGASEVLKSKS